LVSDQLPQTLPVFVHVWLAAKTLEGASPKIAMAAARNLTSRLGLSSATWQAAKLGKRAAE
jgi:hypothetical protein